MNNKIIVDATVITPISSTNKININKYENLWKSQKQINFS